MKKNKEKIRILDFAILTISCIFVAAAYLLEIPETAFRVSAAAAAICCIALIFNLIQLNRPDTDEEAAAANLNKQFGAQELVLLDEQDKPIKSWTLAGKISMIIGRNYKDEEADVDLSDCEYGVMIDVQHAVLNYCLDTWYLEDLDSHNGVRVRKVEDGLCYRLTQSRPCRIEPGDVIYIANTKLLLT